MFGNDANDEWSKLAYWMRSAAFEQCPQALMLLDPIKNRYVDCNQAACRLLGYDRMQILETSISSIHGRDLGQLIVFSEQVLEQGKAVSRLIRYRSSDGYYLPCELNAARTVVNQREMLIVAITDLQEQQALEKLNNADKMVRGGILEWKYLQSIFQEGEQDKMLMLTSVGDGIYCVDTNGICTFINPAAKRLLGRSDDEVLGQNIHYVHHHSHGDGSHYPVEQCPIYAAIRDGVVHEGKQEVFWKQDSTPFPVEFTSTPIISDSTIIGAIVVFRDISERLETEQRLKDTLVELSALKSRLEDENEYLQKEMLIEQRFHGFVGESDAIKSVLKKIELVSKSGASVLVTGESGTGKELIARAIHEASPISDKPLIRVNCAAIPRELFESEFFGHVKGAFTGALKDRLGRFELANGGTIFLDEVGEIPIELQSKLLRVLQEGQLERLGEEKTRNVNVRVIAATNRDLKKEVAQGRFREDLYFRLNVFPIHSPPLRERKEDIPLLAFHFLEKINQHSEHKPNKLKKTDLEKMQSYSWPGNIRELQNVVERAIITAVDNTIKIDLPAISSVKTSNSADVQECSITVYSDNDMQEKVKANMLAALEQCDWKLFGEDGAAKLLDMKPTTLTSRIKRMNLVRKK
ncbi:sigma 54-interacting transcriptional regulator [Agarilytica rhodophyticola]|uniref:sigma 54-interacting transcriptional regulator n=1 Tax=Agarilytica rhodophyticola TaxID=1737490 RepID=UPI000B349D9C|nr:sigma 54-interacting transcriptional regulator [Agarilytica rhodophyticola]